MAIYHAHAKMIGRKTHNTAGALAYRAGTTLTCPMTGITLDYATKSVPWVGLLLPKDAPKWIRDIQEEITHNKSAGVQKFCNVVELAEKRVDAQVYREFEFTLPRELTLEQNIALANEFLQDQVCGMGIAVMANVHLENDANGDPHPHCHALFLTRRLEEKGLCAQKEREWNAKTNVEKWRETLAQYTNFHLAMHGHAARVSHLSYVDQGIDLRPQPKRGWRGHFEEREAISAPRSASKQRELDQHLSHNTAKILARPEIIFEAIAKRQSTFMWGDVEALLAANIKDKNLFHALSQRLLSSRELVCLGEIKKRRHASAPIQDTRIYTTRGVRALETSLMESARAMGARVSHGVDPDSQARVVHAFDEKLKAYGGLSKDQKEALSHMLDARQLACVTGYAGTGKTTLVEAARDVWQEAGLQVVGLAPTGRARDNLTALGLKAMTVHAFLRGYENGRNQYKSDTVFVLDEAGMVDVERFSHLLGAAKKLGVKLVAMGDSGQLQAIEAGDAFRLVGEASLGKHLTHVVRQREAWQRNASRAFGEGRTREGIEAYLAKGHIRIVDESLSFSHNPVNRGDMEGVVRLYNQTRRMTGNMYARMREDLEIKMGVKPSDLHASLSSHPDWRLFKTLCDTRRDCVNHMMGNLESARPRMRSLGVDPVEFARTFTDREMDSTFQSEDVTDFIHAWHLPLLDARAPRHVCDMREGARSKLLEHWKTLFEEHSHKTFLISTNSKAETNLLNQELRTHLREIKVLKGRDVSFKTYVTHEDSLGKTSTHEVRRSFAQGDRLLFMKNEKGLGVSNGDLGTVLKVSEQNMKVRLDSGKEVSFSPSLYKHFDHGWAVNIYKTQGLTVDYHFVLGTLQDYQNLSYVALTRHRENVFMYASALEFWRQEVLVETLSKSKQKLTSLDYGEGAPAAPHNDGLVAHVRLRASDMVRTGFYAVKQGMEDVGVRYFGATPRGQDFFVPQGALPEHERAKDLKMFSHLTAQDTGVSSLRTKVSFLGKRPDQIQHTDPLSHVPKDRQKVTGFFAPVGDVQSTVKAQTPQKEVPPPKGAKAPQRKTSKLSPHEMQSFMDAITRNTDVAGLSLALMDAHGLPLNKALSKEDALRFGNKGSVVVNTAGKKQGTWKSFEEDKGGGLVQLVQHVKGGSFKEALSHIAPFVTGHARQDMERFLGGEAPTRLMTQGKEHPVPQHDKALSQEKDKARKHQEVKALVALSLPVELTVASDYLKGRQLKKDAPKSLRFLTPGTTFTYQGKTKTVMGGGVLISCAVDEKGTVQAAQVTYLDKDGVRARNGEGNKFSKITFGSPKGAFVSLQKGEGPLYVAEGVETALSLREVGVKGTIVASLGISNMAHLPAAQGRDVILVADWDGENAPSHKLLEKAEKSLTEKGMNVRTLWPSKTSEHKLDFNDLLMLTTHDVIKDRIHAQHPDLPLEGRVAKDVVSEEIKDLQNLFETHNPRNPTFLKRYRSKLESASHIIISSSKREELSKQSLGLQDFVWHHFNAHEQKNGLTSPHTFELFMRHADALSKTKPLSSQHQAQKKTLGEISHRMSQDTHLMQEIASTHPHLLESIAAHTQNHLNTLQHAHTQSRGMDF